MESYGMFVLALRESVLNDSDGGRRQEEIARDLSLNEM